MISLPILIIGTVLGCIILFLVVKKVLKFLFFAFALIVTAIIIGTLFVTGDGEMTKDILSQEDQQKLEQIRNESKDKLKEKVTELKEKAVEKAEKGIEQAVQTSKEKMAEELTGQTKQPETTTEKSEDDVMTEE